MFAIVSSQTAASQRLEPGVAVRVRASQPEPSLVTGTFVRSDGGVLVLQRQDGDRMGMSWLDISQAEYRAGRASGMPYAIIGGTAGALVSAVTLGVLWNRACSGPECKNIDPFGPIALGSFLGWAIGGGVGYLLRPSEWLAIARPEGVGRATGSH
ncbi:hypothetical protein BH11GEM1_BH11GEM1_14920 [soil metagenome]